MENFNNRSRPKKVEDKNKKRNISKSAYAAHEGQRLILNAFSSGIFPTKETKDKGFKILTPKKLLQRLPIALAQIKADNTSEYLLNEIRQIVYSLSEQRKLLKKYITVL